MACFLRAYHCKQFDMQTDVESSQDQHGEQVSTACSLDAGSQRSAAEMFKGLVDRIVDPANWRPTAGAAVTRHLDESGNDPQREIREGDYLEIQPANEGEIHWVRLERIERRLNPCAEWEAISFKLRPVEDPTKTEHPPMQQHLRANEYCVLELQREKDKISTQVHGRDVISADHWHQFMQELLHHHS